METTDIQVEASGEADVLAKAFSSIGTYTDPELDSVWGEWVRFVALAAPLHLILARFIPGTSPDVGESLAIVAAAALCGLLAVATTARRAAMALAAVTLTVEACIQFPETPNHLYLHAFLAMVTYLGFGADRRERANAITALRWIFVVVMGWAGIQKIVYGAYFRGEYLAYITSVKPFVHDALGWTMSEAELRRLVAFGAPSVGDGPYRVDSPILWIAGIGTWVAEIAVAVGMLFRAHRPKVAVATFLVLAVIEVFMREFVFGALIAGVTGLFLSVGAMRLTSRVVLVGLLGLVLMRVFVPGWSFN